MARVRFTPNLVRLFPDLRDAEIEVTTIAEAVRALEAAGEAFGRGFPIAVDPGNPDLPPIYATRFA